MHSNVLYHVVWFAQTSTRTRALISLVQNRSYEIKFLWLRNINPTKSPLSRPSMGRIGIKTHLVPHISVGFGKQRLSQRKGALSRSSVTQISRMRKCLRYSVRSRSRHVSTRDRYALWPLMWTIMVRLLPVIFWLGWTCFDTRSKFIGDTTKSFESMTVDSKNSPTLYVGLNRWPAEYLNILQRRNKWHLTQANIKEGEMVACSSWRISTVVLAAWTSHTSAKTRVITIKCQSSTMNRPIAKICVLPINDNNQV